MKRKWFDGLLGVVLLGGSVLMAHDLFTYDESWMLSLLQMYALVMGVVKGLDGVWGFAQKMQEVTR